MQCNDISDAGPIKTSNHGNQPDRRHASEIRRKRPISGRDITTIPKIYILGIVSSRFTTRKFTEKLMNLSTILPLHPVPYSYPSCGRFSFFDLFPETYFRKYLLFPSVRFPYSMLSEGHPQMQAMQCVQFPFQTGRPLSSS